MDDRRRKIVTDVPCAGQGGCPVFIICDVCHTEEQNKQARDASRRWGQLRESDLRPIAEAWLSLRRQAYNESDVGEAVCSLREVRLHRSNDNLPGVGM